MDDKDNDISSVVENGDEITFWICDYTVVFILIDTTNTMIS